VEELPELPAGLEWVLPPFRRGFPALVQARDGAAFVAEADRLFDLAPVESLELAAAGATDVRALAACPGLARLKRLVIREGAGQATAQVMLNSPHLGSLEELVIGAGLTSARTAAAVVGSPAFRRLRSFSYRDEQRGGAMVNALAGLASPPPLRALDLQGNRLTGEGLERLAAAPFASGLEILDIGDNTLGPAGFAASAVGAFPALRGLSAMGTYPGANGIFAAGVSLSTLRALNLGGNHLGPDGGAAVATLGFRELRVLDLRDNQIGDLGVHGLLAFDWVGGLLQLDLAENRIGEAGADALLAARGLDGLIALDLGGNPIPADARTALRERFGARLLL
jgi:hypothetical protein